MTSPPRQDVKNFLFPSSASSRNMPGATTSALLHNPDVRHIRPLCPLSSIELRPQLPLPSAVPMPMPPLQTIPTRYEHRHKRHNLLLGPLVLPVQSLLRPATIMSGGSYNGPQLPPPPNVGSNNEMLRFSVSMAEDINSIAGAHYTDRDEIAAAAQLYHYYLEPSVRLLAQNRLADMGVIQPALYDGKVGLLPGLHGDFMDNYEKPLKGQRAPREDLSPYTAEEKVERRKARAREYSTIARKRQEAIETEFKLDLGYMRSFRVILEEGPNMVAVVAPDLEADVLYANETFGRALEVPPKRLLGRSLWGLVHEADHLAVRDTLISVILSKSSSLSHVPCRILAPRPDVYLRVQVSLAVGTQGVICVFWRV